MVNLDQKKQSQELQTLFSVPLKVKFSSKTVQSDSSLIAHNLFVFMPHRDKSA